MAFHKLPLLLFLSITLLFFNNPVLGDTDEEDILMRDLNTYRTSLNLSALIENDAAECLADEIADQFRNQPCTNSTGANTVPGTEPQFPNFPQLLAKCRLSAADTRDGSIMPACIPRLEFNAAHVTSNFTMSQYSKSLNDSKFTGIGIGTEDDWIVVVLTTSTPTGNFAPTTPGATPTPGATTPGATTPGGTQNSVSSGFTISIGLVSYFVILMCFFMH